MFAVMNLAGYSAPEADDLRKAISKKQKDKLLKHREKFISGAVGREIKEETAAKIFDEWEEFARYGFNKAHAADYGVLAVQTAHLKSRYPGEYMTAVLSVNQNDTSKVALYAADCRRMGIEVAPPDINISEWDFSIEDLENNKIAIRFGLGAVKNVGHAPVDVILTARAEGGPFKDINDFAHRVDLRQVGKRSLECLVRVGALDQFGTRPAILQSLERLISFSAAHFRAIEVGQMTLFGPGTGLQEEFSLPKLSREISKREQLNWERELIGLYVSDHPLNPVMDVLTDAVTHYAGQLADANPKDQVRVAGIITRFRTHQTKNNQTMAFATLEDLQGEIELVIFPRLWSQVSNLIEIDKLILAKGRVDLESSEPKVLVNSFETDLKITTVREAAPEPEITTSQAVDVITDVLEPEVVIETQSTKDVSTAEDNRTSETGETRSIEEEPTPFNIQPENVSTEEVREDNVDWQEEEDAPPQPEIFSQDWELTNAVIAAVSDPEGAIELAEKPPAEAAQPPASSPGSEPANVGQVQEDSSSISPPVEVELPTLPPLITTPPPEAESDAVYMITINLRSSHDKVRDNLRIRQIYGTLITYPGKDRFAFHVFERGHGYLIEFPNFTTKLCPDLLNRLKAFIPADQVRVERIRFQ
jgi:DNA polymerase-3 subunit alpha